MFSCQVLISRSSRSVSDSSESLDDSSWHSRHIDPAEADIYLDALFGPLFYRFERVQKDQNTRPLLSDYRLVSLFLMLNVALQISICFKIYQVTDETYGDVGGALFGGACWRISSAGHDFVGLLYPENASAYTDSSKNDFDCVQPILTLSMFPNELDLNQDGFWTSDEATLVSQQLMKRGSSMASTFTNVLNRMAKFDALRPNSKSSLNPSRHNLGLKLYTPWAPNITKNHQDLDDSCCIRFKR